MSPDPLALARAYVALPGFRWRAGMRAVCAKYPGYALRIRGERDGVVIPAPHGRCEADYAPFPTAERLPPGHEWVPDLTDDATGGVMLGMLGPVMEPMLWYSIDAGYCIRRIGEPFGPCCDTLAEACARVAVALGRAA